MALELPDYVVVAFNLIGLPWPGIDEDELRAWARGIRQFAGDLCDKSSQVNQTMRELADSSESSVIDAVAGEWERHDQLIAEFREPAEVFADALDVAADAVFAQKLVIIGAAAALAAEFTATQIGAIFSLGADEAAVPAEVISTRAVVKFALEELAGVILGRLINIAAADISDHLNRTISGMLKGTLQVGIEVQSLKLTPKALTDVSRKLTGQASEVKATGDKAHAENTGRDVEDNTGGSGWGEVINALRQMLADIAIGVFKNLPATIAKVLGDIAEFILRFAGKVMKADDDGAIAAPAEGPRAAVPESGTGTGPLGAGGDNPHAGAPPGDAPGHAQSVGERPSGIDPVDLATGEVMLSEADVTLPGVLPLVLERTHRSSMRAGLRFGRSWTSSLDQRLLVTADRITGTFADGRILTWTPPDGRYGSPVIPLAGPAWPLWHDPDGSYAVRDPQRGLTWRFEHRAGYGAPDGDGGEVPLVSITDRAGHEIAFHYDTAGQPLSVAHSAGYRVLVSIAGGHVTGLDLAGGEGEQDVPLRRFQYDADGNLAGVINSSGLPMRFTYDDTGRLTSWTDRNDYYYRYTYDDRGRCVRGEGPGGALSSTLSYEPGVTRVASAAQKVTTYEITDAAEIAAITDPLGHVTRFGHDRRGRVTSRTDPLGRVTRYAYDDRGNLVEVTRPDGVAARAEYDERSLPVLVAEPDGAVWRQLFDERGNRTEATAPDGTVTRFGYDSSGHPASVTGPDGAVTVVACDAAGLLVEVTAADGAVSRYERDQFGRAARTTGPDGAVTAVGWSVAGQPETRTMPGGASESWEWDGEGNMVRHVSPAGAATTYEYGPFDKPTAMTWPDGTRTQFGYDHELRVTAVIHGGMTWSYEYDAAGRLTAETDYNGAVTRYEHDAAGQVIRRINAAGQETTFRYDNLGNLTEQVTGDAVTTFRHDKRERLIRARNADAEITLAHDALGRVITETCNGRTVTTSYDAASRVIRRVTPSGAETAWTYDTVGLPSVMTAAGRELRFGYGPDGLERRRELPGGAVLAQEWDVRGRLASQTLTGASPERPALPGQVLQQRRYVYNPDGFVTGTEELLAGSRAFGLDAAGRVTTVSGQEWSERYAYDQSGTMTSATWPSIAPGAADDGWLGAGVQGAREVDGTRVVRAGNVQYRHDAAGRVVARVRRRISRKPETSRYEWNADSRLTAVTTPDGSVWRYTYDPLGRRIAKQHVSASGEMLGETRFTWDGAVLAEQAETVTADCTRERVTTWDYQPRTFAPLTQSSRTMSRDTPQEEVEERFHAIIADLTGAPSELVAPDGSLAGYQQHTLWGDSSWHSPGASAPLRFPGQYEDSETGLHYNNQRYYDPATGGYLSPDPLGLTPTPNPYAYASNPHVETDPLGLAPGSSSGGGLEDNIGLGPGYTGRMDTFPIGKGTDFEIHVYHKGREIGIFGSNGWFAKHGKGPDVSVPQNVEDRLKGKAIEFMRRSGRIGPKGIDDVTGDKWKRPRLKACP